MCNSPEEQESLTHLEFTTALSWPFWDTETLIPLHVCETAALGLSWDNQSLRRDRKNFLSLSRCFSTNRFSFKRIRANLSDWCCADEVGESHMLDPWGSTTSSTMGLSSAKETNKTCHNTKLFLMPIQQSHNDPLVLTCSRYWVDTWGDQHDCCHQ